MIKDNHKIEIALSATLSAKVVEELIQSQVEQQTGRKVVKITTNYDSNKFEGYHIVFAPETALSSTIKTSKEFIEQRWE